MVFGILGIIAGAFCVLLAGFMLIGMAASQVAAQTPASSMPTATPKFLMPMALLYLLPAAWFIWMGIGSIKARRWARALILVSSWLWLVSGVVSVVSIVVLRPNFYTQMAQKDQIPAAVAMVMSIVMLVFMVVLYVVVPGMLVLFYGSRHVKATCERLDPQVRWTDKCPLPVLAVSFMFAVWFCCLPLTGFAFYAWLSTSVSAIVAGVLCVIGALVLMAMYGYVAWGTYRLRIAAWWAAVAVFILWAVLAGIMFSRMSLMDFYAKAGFTPQQLDTIRSSIPSQSSMLVFSSLWLIAVLGYLVYTRRFFTQGNAAQPGPAQQV